MPLACARAMIAVQDCRHCQPNWSCWSCWSWWPSATREVLWKCRSIWAFKEQQVSPVYSVQATTWDLKEKVTFKRLIDVQPVTSLERQTSTPTCRNGVLDDLKIILRLGDRQEKPAAFTQRDPENVRRGCLDALNPQRAVTQAARSRRRPATRLGTGIHSSDCSDCIPVTGAIV